MVTISPKTRTSAVPRAFSYIRFSSKRQVKGDSFRRQADFAKEVCLENDWVLDDTLDLSDRGVAAFRGQNYKIGALGRFLEAIGGPRVLPGSILIIESIDRLTRTEVPEALELFIGILRRGITIVTREPRRTYTIASINDIAGILDPLIGISRAHEESAHKSFRIGGAWLKKKQQAAESKKPMTHVCPKWMKLTPQGYCLVDPHARTVKKIFELCIEGLGSSRILERLLAEPEKYPCFGRTGRWRTSYITTILINRATFGEFQAGTRDTEGRQIPFGEPIPGYYPAVITEDTFHLAQSAIGGRTRRGGRPGEAETNLFTKLVYNRDDNITDKAACRMHMKSGRQPRVDGGELFPYRYLVAKKREYGKKCRGGNHSFPYDPFEEGVLDALSELTAIDIFGKDAKVDEREDEIGAIIRDQVVIEHKIKQTEEKIAESEDDADAYFGLLKTLNAKKKAAVLRLETLKADTASCKAVNLSEVQSLIALMRTLKVEGKIAELKEIRRKLKSKIEWLVTEIWVEIERHNHTKRTAHVQIHLRTGQQKDTVIRVHNGGRKSLQK